MLSQGFVTDFQWLLDGLPIIILCTPCNQHDSLLTTMNTEEMKPQFIEQMKNANTGT